MIYVLKTLWELKKMIATSISSFPTMFSKDFSFRVLKVRIVWKKVKALLEDKILINSRHRIRHEIKFY